MDTGMIARSATATTPAKTGRVLETLTSLDTAITEAGDRLHVLLAAIGPVLTQPGEPVSPATVAIAATVATATEVAPLVASIQNLVERVHYMRYTIEDALSRNEL